MLMELARIVGFGVAPSCCCFPEGFQKIEVVVKGRVGRGALEAGQTPGTVWTEQEAQFSVSCVAFMSPAPGSSRGHKAAQCKWHFHPCPDESLRGVCACGVGNSVFNILILL